ncbi:MAG: hypothetical protein DWQ31_14400 [Planctomycetota bacterium]|nr:MAG: hypothetical protein DWQ31_14400 [Planctomycetota bacterium]REJ94557.1 MAG: hypothetical protein DWQ35_08105 [Planctomycetota bacterium]REK18580.1 MAG: hypothetical protein DWQ42_19365 [Planctomycetota bacterium]REK37475.1 MAG: hypothetical protein DWQ46_21840 [Planctomycetota bacterium]
MSQKQKFSQIDSIDFLPAHYREQSAQRQVHLWRIVVLGVLAAMLPLASIYQYRLRSQLESQLGEVLVHYNQAKLDETRLTSLREQLAAADADAELYTFLAHRWPTTQLLAAVTGTLPPTIALSELKIDTNSAASNVRQRAPVRRPTTRQAAEVPTRSPTQQDLAQLREEAGRGPWVIAIEGETLDTAALYSYVNRLSDHPLVVRAELDSVEASRSDARPGTPALAKFRVRVLVVPGYGLPNGPQGPRSPSQASEPKVAKSQGAVPQPASAGVSASPANQGGQQ